jgi:hypothetical protein
MWVNGPAAVAIHHPDRDSAHDSSAGPNGAWASLGETATTTACWINIQLAGRRVLIEQLLDVKTIVSYVGIVAWKRNKPISQPPEHKKADYQLVELQKDEYQLAEQEKADPQLVEQEKADYQLVEQEKVEY